MGRRISLEIMAEILILCQEPRARTRVMYLTNLSHKLLVKYLGALQNLRLLEVYGSAQKYATTMKGLEFLEKWIELQDMVSEDFVRAFPNETKARSLRELSPFPFQQVSS